MISEKGQDSFNEVLGKYIARGWTIHGQLVVTHISSMRSTNYPSADSPTFTSEDRKTYSIIVTKDD